jgi:hypothetical protein
MVTGEALVWDTTELLGEGCEQVFAGGKNEVLIFYSIFYLQIF